MNGLFFRIAALIANVLLNVIVISYLTDYDITGSWKAVFGFLAVLFLLMAIFITHLVSFINYIKTKTK